VWWSVLDLRVEYRGARDDHPVSRRHHTAAPTVSGAPHGTTPIPQGSACLPALYVHTSVGGAATLGDLGSTSWGSVHGGPPNTRGYQQPGGTPGAGRVRVTRPWPLGSAVGAGDSRCATSDSLPPTARSRPTCAAKKTRAGCAASTSTAPSPTATQPPDESTHSPGPLTTSFP